MTDTTSAGALAKAAYEAHAAAMDWVPVQWDEMTQRRRDAWEAAAVEVAAAVSNPTAADFDAAADVIALRGRVADLEQRLAGVTAELGGARAANARTGQRWLDAEAEATALRAECERLRTENTQFRETNEALRTGMELLNARLSLLDGALAQVAMHVDNPDSPQLRIVAKIARRARATSEPEPQT